MKILTTAALLCLAGAAVAQNVTPTPDAMGGAGMKMGHHPMREQAQEMRQEMVGEMKAQGEKRYQEMQKHKAARRSQEDALEARCHSAMQAAATPEAMKAAHEQCRQQREALHQQFQQQREQFHHEMKANRQEMKQEFQSRREDMKKQMQAKHEEMRDQMQQRHQQMRQNAAPSAGQ